MIIDLDVHQAVRQFNPIQYHEGINRSWARFETNEDAKECWKYLCKHMCDLRIQPSNFYDDKMVNWR